MLTALLLASSAQATQVKVFRSSSQSAFLAGTLESISVDPLGTLRLARRTQQVAKVDEPYLFSSHALRDGWVIGTGNRGRVLKVALDGTTRVLFETDEPEIFAVFADADGSILAGSSPHGKVYRYADGEVSVLFDPQQTYIWQIGRDRSGKLLVATGTDGKLIRIGPDGSAETIYDSKDPHIRSFLVLSDGSVLAGTAGEGLVLRIDLEGKVQTLHDAAAPEVVAITAAADGGAYIAVVGSEASFVDLQRSSSNGKGKEDDKEDSDEEVEVKDSAKAAGAGSRVRGFRGPRSSILHWTPSTPFENIWSFEKETVFDLVYTADRLWVATGLDGKLFSLQNDQMVLERDVEEAQIVALMSHDNGPVFSTTNAAALYRFTAGIEQAGSLTSSVLDAKQISRFGTLHWEGDQPTGTRVSFSVRSGMSAEPDATWSTWTDARNGAEISLPDLQPTRYLQWRLHLMSENGSSPSVWSIEVSYRQLNRKPEITSLTVLDPGQVLVPSSFNANNQVYEPAHPNRDGIFTTIGSQSSRESKNLKTLWKQGYRTLRWKATDPNDDELRYEVSFRKESEEDTWFVMSENLKEQRYSFDSTVLPDGRYRLRIVASDKLGNVDGEHLTSSKISELVVIDHSGPTVDSVQADIGSDGRRRTVLSVTTSDTLSRLREAVYSLDAKEWQEAAADDGLIDGRREVFSIDVEEGARLLLLRLTDASFNVTTYDLSQYLE